MAIQFRINMCLFVRERNIVFVSNIFKRWCVVIDFRRTQSVCVHVCESVCECVCVCACSCVRMCVRVLARVIIHVWPSDY